MRRLVIVISVLVIVPAIEIAVLIAVGQIIGFGWALLIMLATSALGAWLLRREGTRAWLAFRADVSEGRPPGRSATDGVLVLAGGVFMLVPGFVSDLIGLSFLLPVTRPLGRAVLLRVAQRRFSAATSASLFGPRTVRARTGPAQHAPTGRPPTPPSDAIEGEIVDD